jgi:AraC-like DNA-binding protein
MDQACGHRGGLRILVDPVFLCDSPGMADQLSEVFDLVEVRGQMSSALAARGPWTVARTTVSSPLKFVIVVRGGCRVSSDGGGPVELAPGEVAILNNRSWLAIESVRGAGPPREVAPDLGLGEAGDPGADVLVCGHVDFNPAGRALLLSGLPEVGHVRASADGLREVIDRLVDETAGARAGSAFAIRQYGQLLLLEMLRAYLDQAELPPGWLRVLTDERLRPAVSLMHAEPGRPWGLVELARSANMSRSSFAERFRQVAGVPPLTYLNTWRMLLAQRALRDGDVRIGPLAAELGYASESSFSTAFKREVGVSPLRFRTGRRADRPGG